LPKLSNKCTSFVFAAIFDKLKKILPPKFNFLPSTIFPEAIVPAHRVKSLDNQHSLDFLNQLLVHKTCQSILKNNNYLSLAHVRVVNGPHFEDRTQPELTSLKPARTRINF